MGISLVENKIELNNIYYRLRTVMTNEIRVTKKNKDNTKNIKDIKDIFINLTQNKK